MEVAQAIKEGAEAISSSLSEIATEIHDKAIH
jgi:hypothetical protein